MLIQGIQEEQRRCRELLERYKAIGPAGRIGAFVIQRSIDDGDRAIASGDVVKMVVALANLREKE